ncbi:MAG: polyphosphate kinase 2 family protein [Gemmatimonadaceae bacterium]|nr:polyphosphate kinase 2 family protein [Gemmatimonadaceae bacterium]
MKLSPIRPHDKISLGDSAALPPRSLDADDRTLERKLDKLRARLDELQNALYAESKRSLLVVLQARDAGGKDGTIRRVFSSVNPQGCTVTTFKAPTPMELAHDYLWRVHAAVPAHGMIGIFNRSHYEDVLAARVHKLVPKKTWKLRYEQINEFERTLTMNGVTILKFFLHISKEEQRVRLVERLNDPAKNWKFEAGDLEERGLWDDYTRAYVDALRECSTKWAPWYLVPGDRKHARDFLVLEAIVSTLEAMKPEYPKADPKALRLLPKLELPSA